jgi:hypothetical protein
VSQLALDQRQRDPLMQELDRVRARATTGAGPADQLADRSRALLLHAPDAVTLARLLLPGGCSILASTLLTAARLIRAPSGRLLLVMAERHCGCARRRTGSRRWLALASGLPCGCTAVTPCYESVGDSPEREYGHPRPVRAHPDPWQPGPSHANVRSGWQRRNCHEHRPTGSRRPPGRVGGRSSMSLGPFANVAGALQHDRAEAASPRTVA